MSEYAWLKTPLHKNMFKDDILDEAVMENIKMSFDGSIIGVQESTKRFKGHRLRLFI
jgi:hypothetical protein